MRHRYFTLPSSQSLRQSRLLKPFDRLLTGGAVGGAPDENVAAQQAEVVGHAMRMVEWAHSVGVPLALGLGVFALGSAATGYMAVAGVGRRWRVLRRWARRE